MKQANVLLNYFHFVDFLKQKNETTFKFKST